MHRILVKLRSWMVLLCLSTTATVVMADDAIIGFVKTVSNNASIVVTGNTVAAQPGMALRVGHVLKTGQDGSMGVLLKDNTSLSIGPDTELVVDEYLYAPGQEQLRLTLNFIKGSLNYVSGIIARLKPEAVSIKTPTGIIGVRGTQFLAKVEPEAKS